MVPRVEPKGAPEMCTDPAEVSPVRYQEIKNFDDETVKGQLLIQLRGASSYRGTYSSLRAEDLPQVTTGEILGNIVEFGDFECYRWIDANGQDRIDPSGQPVTSLLPETYLIDFKDGTLQDKYMGRMVYFSEIEPGVLLSQDQKDIFNTGPIKKIGPSLRRTTHFFTGKPNFLRLGNHLTAQQIATFYNRVSEKELTEEEGILLDYLLNIGFIQGPSGPSSGYEGDPKKVLLTAFQPPFIKDDYLMRKFILKQERIHGLILSNPDSLVQIRNNYEKLSEEEKAFLKEVLWDYDHYHPSDEFVRVKAAVYFLASEPSRYRNDESQIYEMDPATRSFLGIYREKYKNLFLHNGSVSSIFNNIARKLWDGSIRVLEG